MTAGFSLFGMNSDNGMRKKALKFLNQLGSEGDFGDENDTRTEFLKLLHDKGEIEIGFAGTSDAVKKLSVEFNFFKIF